MLEQLVDAIAHFLENYLSPEIIVFIISMLPILELRGGLIAAAIWGVPWKTAAAISVLGNTIPIPFIIMFIRHILDWMAKTKLFHKLAVHFIDRANQKGTELMQKHARRVKLGLYIFVAIPLPMTGAWTGALIAAFLGFKARDAFLPILAGVVTAACIMLGITYLVPAIIMR